MKSYLKVCIDLLPITDKLLEFVGCLIPLLTACPWCWGETLFCSTHLKWDYAKRCIDGVMPQYIHKALIRFQHPHSACPQHSPQKYTPTSYGNNPWTDPDDTRAPLMPNKSKKSLIHCCIIPMHSTLPYHMY